jgi:4'-phosphopantetheinyl transferase
MSGLGDDEVRLVWWRYDLAAPDVLDRAGSVLSATERARLSRFRFPADQRLFLASRVLLREALSAVDGRPAAALRFTSDVHGVKPELEGTPQERPLRFNLTHTDGLVACVLAWNRAVGVDAERLTRVIRTPGVAARVLSDTEQAALAGVEPGLRSRRLLEHWCVKEALLKAMGTGLATPPSTVCVQFDGAARAAFADAAVGRDWQVTMATPGGAHVVAVVARRGADGADGADGAEVVDEEFVL